VFTARYGLSPYIKQTRLVFKGLMQLFSGPSTNSRRVSVILSLVTISYGSSLMLLLVRLLFNIICQMLTCFTLDVNYLHI
jgi:hypothetical protein